MDWETKNFVVWLTVVVWNQACHISKVWLYKLWDFDVMKEKNISK